MIFIELFTSSSVSPSLKVAVAFMILFGFCTLLLALLYENERIKIKKLKKDYLDLLNMSFKNLNIPIDAITLKTRLSTSRSITVKGSEVIDSNLLNKSLITAFSMMLNMINRIIPRNTEMIKLKSMFSRLNYKKYLKQLQPKRTP